jgi:hypothetical protein
VPRGGVSLASWNNGISWLTIPKNATVGKGLSRLLATLARMEPAEGLDPPTTASPQSCLLTGNHNHRSNIKELLRDG